LKLRDRGSWRWIAFALLIASWCTGWLWFLLAFTQGMPGILTWKSDLGAFELLEFLAGRPYPLVLFAVFLLCMLLPLLLGVLRGWWDRDGRAREALAWPLRAMSFWLPCFLWWTGWIAISFAFQDREGLELAAMAISMLMLIATPFLCLNPSTLDDAAPARWWRPGWPGLGALATCLALWAAYALASFAVGEVIAIGSATWLTVSLWVLDELLSACVLVVVIAIWLNRRHWRAVQSDLLGICRNGFVSEYLWQSMAIAVGLVALAFPLLVAAIQAIFVIPQYEQWTGDTGRQLPIGLRLQIEAYRSNGILLFVSGVPFGLYFTLVQGRLLRQHGVGKGIATK
jgi:hypothetical protein